MAKKADEAEIKKECPSCGLGVALDSKACEFCGWDFDEEDEWILQIEKLERDLIMEKQRFEPGSVEDKIESTLKSPFYQRSEETERAQKGAAGTKQAAGPAARSSAKAAPEKPAPVVRETKASGVKVFKPVDTSEEPRPVVRTITPAPAPKPAPAQVQAPRVQPVPERIEPVAEPAAPKPQGAAPKTKKTRVVRKVKKS